MSAVNSWTASILLPSIISSGELIKRTPSWGSRWLRNILNGETFPLLKKEAVQSQSVKAWYAGIAWHKVGPKTSANSDQMTQYKSFGSFATLTLFFRFDVEPAIQIFIPENLWILTSKIIKMSVSAALITTLAPDKSLLKWKVMRVSASTWAHSYSVSSFTKTKSLEDSYEKHDFPTVRRIFFSRKKSFCQCSMRNFTNKNLKMLFLF